MRYMTYCFVTLLSIFLPFVAIASINVGIGKADITPPIGTPSSGYTDRKGEGMEGVHDPLLALALYIDTGEKQIVLCSVDHLGFTYDIVQEITRKIHSFSELKSCEIFIASSHTHSGGGAYLSIPVLGASLAGRYDANITQLYIERTCDAICQAYHHQTPAKIGIGYGEAEVINRYRGLWPRNAVPVQSVAVIKVTRLDNTPLAILFNYPMHPTVLQSHNRLFSADFVGYARDHIQSEIGSNVQPIYFNGAQGDVIPRLVQGEDPFQACERIGKSLSSTVHAIWKATSTNDTIQIDTIKESFSFQPQATPSGLILPVENYKSEMNLIVFNKQHACITIPGELSCLYDRHLKELGRKFGFSHVSIFGLTNDAHGYIILPEAWLHRTSESELSFGGQEYGHITVKRAERLLQVQATR